MLIYEFILKNSLRVNANPTVLSQLSFDSIKWNSIEINDGKVEIKQHLQSDIEEADLRFPIHVLDTVRAGYKRCVVMSNDTDVIVTLLFHFRVFIQEGLDQLWVKAGLGSSTRFIPLHILHQKLGPNLINVLPALHSLTGSDITSKVGTKKGALKADPTKYLQSFGATERLDDSVAKEAEQYLVKMIDSRCKGKDFNQLRTYLFHHSKSASLQNLPPTSQGLKPHIQRAHFNTYTTMHILDKQLGIAPIQLDPLDYGFTLENGSLLPLKTWRLLKYRWNVVCHCVK